MRSERLLIRRFTPADLPDFLAYQSDPAVRRHVPGEPMTPAKAADYLSAQSTLDESTLDAWHGYAVQQIAEGRVIGDVGVWLPSEPKGTGDVGFQFHPDFHGQGYAREAMQTFLPYVFKTLALREVTATCNAANTASWGLMKRLGMHRIKQSETELQYALTSTQWQAAL